MNDLPERTEVAIIGGGFAGCATAWALARRGVQAVVLERETQLGQFASGRGAGLGRQLAEDDETTALTIHGAETLRRELAAAWQPTGGILSFDDATLAQAYLARAGRFTLAAEVMRPAQVVERWRSFDKLPIASALWVPSDGVIDVRVLLALYAAQLQVVTEVTVLRVEPGGAGARVVTSRGDVEARVVVDAAGAWAGSATGDPPLDSFKRHLFVLEAAATAGGPYLWHLGARELYVRAEPGGVLVSPCDQTPEPAGDARVDASVERTLRGLLNDVAHDWARAGLVRAWACQRSFTPDRRMRLGRDPQRPWLVWAAGLGGHGATASAAVGERVADAVLATT